MGLLTLNPPSPHLAASDAVVVTLSTWGIHGRDSTFVAPRATPARYCVTKQPRKRNSRRVQHWGSWGWAIPTGECPPVSGTLLAAAVAGSWRDPIPWPACRAGGASRERPGGVVPQLQVCPRSQALETTNCPSPPNLRSDSSMVSIYVEHMCTSVQDRLPQRPTEIFSSTA